MPFDNEQADSGLLVFSRVVEDEVIDFANNVDIDLAVLCPWAELVQVIIEAKHGQTGVDTGLGIRFNGDSAGNYDNQFHFVSGTSISASLVPTRSSIYFGELNDTELDNGMFVALITPKNRGKYPSCMYDLNLSDGGTRTMYRNQAGWKNTVDDITNINVYAVASNKVSCKITARAWR